MLKQRMKQLLLIALSASMMLATGCAAPADDKTTAAPDTTTQGVQNTDAPEESTGGDEVVEITYPLTTDVDLTIWDANSVKINEEYTDYKQSPFHSGLAERTGIDIKWTWPVAGADVTQAFNMLLTDKNLPDLVKRNWTASEGEELIDAGAIWDLTEYLPKYAPDYWEAINKPEYANSLKNFTTSSGKQFIMAAFQQSEQSFTYIGPVVRKDWLDACGLDIPVTIADWEEMLVAFRDKYNVTPFGMVKNYLIGNPNVASATGAYTGVDATYAVKDGKIVLANTMPENKEYYALMNRWYTDGLLDKDSQTMDNNAIRSKALNNEIGVAIVPLSQFANWIADAEAEGTGAEWVAIGYPREAEGVATSMIQTKSTHWAGMGIAFSKSLSEEELITALQWVNYGYTEEGHMYWNFGEEGTAWNYDANGEVAFTDLVTNDVNGINSGLTKYTGASANGACLQDVRITFLKNGEAGTHAVQVWTENTEGPSHKLPNLSFSPDDTMIHKNLWSQIQTYVEETGMKFITGEESLDNWDAFVAKVESMAVAQDIAIYQKAYDEFIAE